MIGWILVCIVERLAIFFDIGNVGESRVFLKKNCDTSIPSAPLEVRFNKKPTYDDDR